jgi:hypothetical protein
MRSAISECSLLGDSLPNLSEGGTPRVRKIIEVPRCRCDLRDEIHTPRPYFHPLIWVQSQSARVSPPPDALVTVWDSRAAMLPSIRSRGMIQRPRRSRFAPSSTTSVRGTSIRPPYRSKNVSNLGTPIFGSSGKGARTGLEQQNRIPTSVRKKGR